MGRNRHIGCGFIIRNITARRRATGQRSDLLKGDCCGHPACHIPFLNRASEAELTCGFENMVLAFEKTHCEHGFSETLELGFISLGK